MAYTNVTRLLGLSSGMDTETLVNQLMNAESMKLNAFKRNAIKISWRQEAYRNVHSKLKSFQAKHLDLRVSNTLRLPSTYRTKTTSIKDSSGADSGAVSVLSGSKDGSYTIDVKQTAKADLYESNARFGREISSEQKFDVGNIEDGDSYSITLGNITRTISFKSNEGVKITGDDGTLLEGTLVFQEVTTGGTTRESTGPDNPTDPTDPTDPGDETTIEKRIGINVKEGDSYRFIELNSEQFVEIFNDKLKSAFGVEGDGQNVQKVEAKINPNGEFSIFTNGYHSTFSIADGKSNSLSGLGLEAGASKGFDTDKSLGEIFGDSLSNKNHFYINDTLITYDDETTLSELLSKINDNEDIGAKISYDDFNGVFRIEATQTGAANKLKLEGEFLTDNLKIRDIPTVAASDAVATISNGTHTTTVTRDSNDFELFGVDWSLKEETNGETLRVNITRDADTIVETIKSFVESYNEMIKDLNSLVNERRAKSAGGSYYDPLLDEERAHLTETQQSQWDEQAKQGLLSRDNILSGITSQLRTMLYQSVEMEDGSSLALFQIGVTTSTDWREGGALVVNETELRKAIEEQGDNIATLFTKVSTNEDSKLKTMESGLAVRLNDIINEATGTYGSIAQKAGIKGGLTEFNNELHHQFVKENEKITKMIAMLTKRENYYYSMFARMEAAVAKSDQQLQSLMSITGS